LHCHYVAHVLLLGRNASLLLLQPKETVIDHA
jgi:hypothetical protein